MQGEVYLSDNLGHRVAPSTGSAVPKLGTGQVATVTTAGEDDTFTVTAGRYYRITGIGCAILVSVTGVTSTAANVEWTAPANTPVLVWVPEGSTTIYCEGDTNTTSIRLVEIDA